MFDLGFFGVQKGLTKIILAYQKVKGLRTSQEKDYNKNNSIKEGYSDRTCYLQVEKIQNNEYDVFRNRLKKYDMVSVI